MSGIFKALNSTKALNDAALTRLQQRLGYQFKDVSLLKLALHHRSLAGESNERLEFLGDALMGLIVADQLFKLHPEAKEGELTRSRVSLVSGKHLAKLAQQFKLDECLELGDDLVNEDLATQHQSILADAMEAIVAAIYLDSSWLKVLSVVTTWLADSFSIEVQLDTKDAKTRLQEWLQQHGYSLPNYTLVASSGPEHAKMFKIACRVKAPSPLETLATASNKKEAQQQAAELMLTRLKVKL